MAKVYYVDVSRTAVNGKWRRKLHYAFDGQKILRVRKLTKLKDASEVFIDTLFPKICDEVLQLLSRGIKVHLLKDATILKRLRVQNNLWKSDEVDAVIISRIPKDTFRA
jgi:hypothetical protein